MLIATCDDEMQYCEQIEKFITKLGTTLGIDVECDKYDSGSKLLNSNYSKYQIIFLDIIMPDENGIYIAEKIRETNQKVEIIFLTALLQYAIDGYKVRAYRFLVKPIQYEDFVFQLKELFIQLDGIEKNKLELRKYGQSLDIKIKDIIYVEVIDHFLTYHCVNCNLSIRGTMRKLENSLKEHFFFRIHNSYIVNMQYIYEIKNLHLLLKNGEELPIARSKRETFIQAYLDFWGEKLG